MEKPGKKTLLVLQVLVSIALLAFILYTLDLESLFQVLARANLVFLGIGVLAYLGLNLLNTFKLGILVHCRDKLFKMKELFSIHLAGMLASDITPGRAGYLYTIILLKDRIRKSHGAAALTVFKLTELIVKIGGAFTAFILLLGLFSGTRLPSYFFFAFALLLILLVFLVLIAFSKRASRLLQWSERLLPPFLDFQERAGEMRGVFFPALFITLAGWLLRGIEWFFVARAVGISLGFFQAVLLHPLITIFAFVPVSIAGLGIVEFAGITIIGNMGVAPPGAVVESVFAFLILDRAMNVFVDFLGIKRLVSFR